MGCPEFDELVREGPGGHAARCEECRALLDALADVDATFEAAFAGVSAPPGMATAVRAHIARQSRFSRPSPLPEILDSIGWAAVLALAAVLLPRFLPLIDAALSGRG